MKNTKIVKRAMRHRRIRAKIEGTAERPRLVVFRSLKHNYAQLIDDSVGKVLAAVTDASIKKGKKVEKASEIGKMIAQAAAGKGIKACVFDRNGYKYHGRVKALADGAREGGLVF